MSDDKRVMIRVPAQDTIDRVTVEWLLWAREALPSKDGHDIGITYTAGLGVAKGRNDIVREFIASECDALWMVDSDTAPPNSLRLLEGLEDYPAVSGAYPGMTQGGIRWHIYKKIDSTTWAPMHPRFAPKTRYFRADAAGTGCMAMTREQVMSLGEDPFEFKKIDAGNFIGEDLLICDKMGGITVDTEYVCEHYRRTPILLAWKATVLSNA